MNRNGNEIPGWGHPEMSEGSEQPGYDEAVARLVTVLAQSENNAHPQTASQPALESDEVLQRVFFGPDRYEF